MKLLSLTSENFRNLSPGEVSFHPLANLIVGRNGQGKTNLLEAIYLLGTTRSFRTTRVGSLFRFDSPNLFVSGILEREGLRRTLSVGLEGGEGRRRVLMINGEKVTLSSYLEASSVVAYSAARLDAIRGTPEERRRFLDRGIASVQRGYVGQLSRYMRVLRQRNALIADIAYHRQSVATLDAWDDELIDAAGAIHRARSAYAEDLARAHEEIVRTHGYHVSNLKISYQPSLTDELPKRRQQEIRARMSLAGPQRDLVEMFIDGRPAAEVLSGGEQKMTVLFLKFAKVELLRRRTGESPLLLLDDIDAELDLEILQKLLLNLPERTQLFATSAKDSILSRLETGPHRRLSLENGRVNSLHDFG
jgi:DNA replication and repair protein RecF